MPSVIGRSNEAACLGSERESLTGQIANGFIDSAAARHVVARLQHQWRQMPREHDGDGFQHQGILRRIQRDITPAVGNEFHGVKPIAAREQRGLQLLTAFKVAAPSGGVARRPDERY